MGFTQQDVQSLFIPLLKKRGRIYKKHQKIYARKAKRRERISTYTSDGKETTNTAKPGDYIVKNQTEAKEEYVLSPQKFRDRYQYIRRSKAGYSEYLPIGKICAMKITKALLEKNKLKKKFYFEASWGSRMVVKENDYLVCPLTYNEIYRIAEKEFFETYQPV